MADRQIKSILRFITDKSSVDRTERDIGRIEKALEEQRAAAEKTQQAFTSLEDVSVRMSAAGAAILTPLTLAANKYAAALGDATETSRRWLAATEKAEAANLELGRKSTEALLPYKELVADILTKISEVDPRILEAGVAIGSGVALVGAAGLIASQIGRFAAMVQILGTHVKALALSQRGQRLGVGAAAVGAGVAGGIGIVRAIGSATGNDRLKQYGLSDVVDTLRDSIGIVGALFIAAAKQLALVFAEIERQWNIGREKVSNLLQQLADTFESAILNFVKAIGELDVDLGRLGSLDIGDKLGINTREINDRLDEIASHSSDYVSRLEEIDRAYDDRVNRINNNTSDLTDGWLRFLGIVKDEQDGMTAAEEKAAAEALARQQQFERDSLDLFQDYFDTITAEEAAYQASSEENLRQHQETRASIEENYQRQQERQLEDHERSLADLRDNYAKQQQKDVADHSKRLQDLQQSAVKDRAAAEKEFVKTRSDAIEQQQKDDLKRLQDYNLKRLREQEDHDQRLLEAAGRRDGIAILNEIRNFNKTKQRGQQDFDKESEQRKQQTNERLADEKQQFEALQVERTNQLKQQIADEKAAFAERQQSANDQFRESERRSQEAFQRQQARQQEDHDRQLAELESQFIEQQRQERQAHDRLQQLRQEDYNRQLRNLTAHFRDDERATADHYRRLTTQQNLYNAVIQQSSANLINSLRQSAAVNFLSGSGGRTRSSSGGVSAQDLIHNPTAHRSSINNRAAGGYFDHGAGKEFALNRDTTSMLERAMGSLTQSKMQQIIGGASTSVGSVVIQMGDVGSHSESSIKRMVFNGVVEALEQIGGK